MGDWTGVNYLGFGLGASSLYDGTRWSNIRDISGYLAIDLLHDQQAEEKLRAEVHELDEKEQMEEYMFLGLRMTRGVSETGFKERFGRTVDNVFGEALSRHLEDGLLLREGSVIRFSERGMDLSNTVLSDLLLD